MASMDLPVLFFLWGSVKACSEMDVETTVSVCMSIRKREKEMISGVMGMGTRKMRNEDKR